MTRPPCLVHAKEVLGEVPQLWLVTADRLPSLRAQWPEVTRNWLEASGFQANPGNRALLPNQDGTLLGAVAVVEDAGSPFEAARIVGGLPDGTYRLADGAPVSESVAALGFALEAYRFPKAGDRQATVSLALDLDEASVAAACRLAEAQYEARDLVNLPANRLGPAELEDRVWALAQRFDASFTSIIGDDLLDENYPAIHAVGRASPRAPRLLDLRWGDPKAPKLTLVGKGVCFDTGGLDIKPSSAMLMMKKDMGGAALMLALAQVLMADQLPVRLRLLIPAVENSVDGAAFRPGDVIDTRKGLTVEIGNTDAEGRLILADALWEASGEEPDLLLDAATLTGAARVALGTDLPALFTPDDRVADGLLQAGHDTFDPLWRLPLFEGYRKSLESPVADLSNTGSSRFAGATTAALFLQAFVAKTIPWAHLDIYAYNPNGRPGRPKGGEASALLALHRYLSDRFGAA